MSLVEDLKAARGFIRLKRNWRKDGRGDLRGCCAVVAVKRTTNSSHRFQNAVYALRNALPESWEAGRERPFVLVGEFNDDPTTTHADVLALFDRAIAKAEEAR
jgi:hypothetical protein